MSVLVTGASGSVGSHVVEPLAARGDPVRALVRPASRAAVLRLGAEAGVGGVTDPAAWQAAARGGRAIVAPAAHRQRRGPRGQDRAGHGARAPPARTRAPAAGGR